MHGLSLKAIAMPMALAAALLANGACLAAPAAAVPVPASREWPGDPAGRLAALAQLQSLNADLLSHDSATATLERWCAAHRLALPVRIEAERVAGPEVAPTAEQRRDLSVSETEPVRHRHVRLKCGARVLSEADNWYVPSRLTPEMNQLLETTNTPFGKVVKPLNFVRHTLEAKLLWSPLPENWETAGIPAGTGAMSVPQQLLRHRALLLLPGGLPFSEVIETYSNELLAVPPTLH